MDRTQPDGFTVGFDQSKPNQTNDTSQVLNFEWKVVALFSSNRSSLREGMQCAPAHLQSQQETQERIFFILTNNFSFILTNKKKFTGAPHVRKNPTNPRY